MLADKLATNCLDTSGCLMTAHVQTWAQYFCSRAKPVRYEYYLLVNYQHKSLNTMNTFIYIWITKYGNTQGVEMFPGQTKPPTLFTTLD